MGAAATRAGRRGRLRPPPGRPVPPRRRRSCAGGPTSRRPTAATTSSRRPPPYELARDLRRSSPRPDQGLPRVGRPFPGRSRSVAFALASPPPGSGPSAWVAADVRHRAALDLRRPYVWSTSTVSRRPSLALANIAQFGRCCSCSSWASSWRSSAINDARAVRPRRRAFLDRHAQRRRRQRRRHDPRLRQRLRATSGPPSATAPQGDGRAQLEGRLASLTSAGEIVRIEVRRPDGSIVVANDPSLAGASAPVGAAFAASLGGHGPGRHRPRRDLRGGARRPRHADRRPRVPAHLHRRPRPGCRRGTGATPSPIVERLDAVRREVVLVTLSAALIASALLLLIFRSAPNRG